MQKNSAISLYRRLSYVIVDEIRKNFRLYIVYFTILIVGIVTGVIWGIRLTQSDVDREVINYLDCFISGECGLFSHFIDFVWTYVLGCIFILLSLKVGIFKWISVGFMALFLAKTVRDGVFLIFSGGLSCILTGALFYIIYSIIYCLVLSFLIVFIILRSRCANSCQYNEILKRVIVFYFIDLAICFVYSLIISLFFCIVLV